MKMEKITIRTDRPDKCIIELECEARYHRQQLFLIELEIERQMKLGENWDGSVK